MTHTDEQPVRNPTLRDLLYRRHSGGTSDDLSQAARGWLDAVHIFAVDALDEGVPAAEVLPAVIQMLEGWMLARDASSLATTWMALDGAVTVLEQRLAQTRAERDRFSEQTAKLNAEREAHRARHRRRQRRHGKRKG